LPSEPAWLPGPTRQSRVFPRLAGIATRGTSLAPCQNDMIQSLSSGMQAQWYRHPQGGVQDDGQTVDTLRVVDFPKPYALIKESRGLFVPADVKVAPEAATDYQVVGGALEESNLNAVRTMVEMIDMLRKYETAQRAIRAEDDAARFASNDIGRLQ